MIVIKFGGSSVSNSKNIERVLNIIKSKNNPCVVVVSAVGGVTNLLNESSVLAEKGKKSYLNKVDLVEKKHLIIIKKLLSGSIKETAINDMKKLVSKLKKILEGVFMIGERSIQTKDSILNFGELLSYQLLHSVAIQKNIDAKKKNTEELIVTYSEKKNLIFDYEKTKFLVKNYFKKNKFKFLIVPGFVSKNSKNKPSNLGRGGSDLTASLLANILNADKLEIWTDVSGMYTANPNLVKNAKVIPEISYNEAMELSHFGAKVIYPPTIQPSTKKNIPITIKNTFFPNEKGTIISKKKTKESVVRGISHIEDISLLTLEGSGMIGVTGYSQKLLSVLSQNNINVIMITQASSEHSICIGINSSDVELAKNKINERFLLEINSNLINKVKIEKNKSIIALVGDKMKNRQGISGKMFLTLGNNNINVKAISQGASERNITAVIEKKDVKKALNILHEAFFEEQIKKIHLFIIGIGNVGGKFIEQISNQKQYLIEKFRLNINIIGISNSKKMFFSSDGILYENLNSSLKKGEKTDLNEFFKRVKKFNLRNSVFIDNTANNYVASTYTQYLKNNIGVVTCNKIACSDNYENYIKLKNLSKKYNTPFLFETNVGAGLPIIDTLNHLIASGDKIQKIQAILSGSLNFIFNNYNTTRSFRDVVYDAMKKGYTEPDPKIDLSGVDVSRKILILARECGHKVELEDVVNYKFLSDDCLNSINNDDLFKNLLKNEKHFKDLYNKANDKNCKLKYVANYENGQASVGLNEIEKYHDFYNIEGSDNIILFYTDRYNERPLIVKGAGAGAEVTASGIFADLIRISKN
ncbi:MAG: bifunctional aspartate kinase/homoserine dehydrogenase I [Bacteroidota bacterium]|nr:bifunctional aspartate kinase/homoserine dehydrogenase I [Bacteroidota bacterium]